MAPTTNASSGRSLVIVESPTKARTIRRYLPSRYEVMASMGHVRDLPASANDIPDRYRGESWARLGMRVDNDFEPLYVVTKPDVVRDLKKALRNVDELVIATDEDREGESIGWHLLELLKPDVPVKRMVFHEITEEAIENALADTRDIDRSLVEAQETRRLLDRLVGYTISPLLWRKIAPRLSAGRVQSVAVRILVQREKERLAFVPASYWGIDATLRGAEGAARPFGATLTHLDGIRLAAGKDFDPDTGRLAPGLEEGRDLVLLGGDTATRLADAAAEAPFTVRSVEEKEQTRHPSAPFTTSTLQQESSRKLGLSARDTMSVAQGLYERGLITYMRTDSTHLSGEAIHASRARIEALYGSDYLSTRPRQYRSKSRGTQEAHEAIRPAGTTMRTADEHALRGRERALYDLIWKRTVATQMAEAKLKFVTARIETEAEGRTLSLRASGRTVLFPGFFRAYVEGSDDPDAALDDRDQPLPPLQERQALVAEALTPSGHETRPPARFTEASLVKTLEQEGIGRPSTYASIIDTIVRRGYVRKNGSQLVPTFTAFATNNLLEEQFAQLVDTEFTAEMEAKLDEIAAGTLEAIPYLRGFYGGDEGIEARVARGIDGIDPKEISTIRAARWDPYVIRVGRYGPYVEAHVDGERITTSVPAEWPPADVTKEQLDELIARERQGDVELGTHEDGPVMLLKNGPYGPYLQLGPSDQEGKPKRVSLPPGVEPAEVDASLARRLLDLPRPVGAHPETGKAIHAGIGRYGPYVRHERTYASLEEGDDVLEIEPERAAQLLAAKRSRGRREPLATLGTHPESDAPVELHDGRFGPYVKHGKTNASLRKDQKPDEMTLETALELLAAREARKASGKGRGASRGKGTAKAQGSSRDRGSTTASSKKAAGKKAAGTKTAGKKASGKKASGKKATGTKKAATPKASPQQLAEHLDLLDAPDREVVVRKEGMNGHGAASTQAVANELGLQEDEVATRHKRGMFKLRMAHGKARRQAEG
ncbi:MAG: type I DNA topoisomerase [Trueperaceae bacterium]|nr:type I DNA topoisomerase [Trueperaceae bacterium]